MASVTLYFNIWLQTPHHCENEADADEVCFPQTQLSIFWWILRACYAEQLNTLRTDFSLRISSQNSAGALIMDARNLNCATNSSSFSTDYFTYYQNSGLHNSLPSTEVQLMPLVMWPKALENTFRFFSLQWMLLIEEVNEVILESSVLIRYDLLDW